jgi:hypothetical protein
LRYAESWGPENDQTSSREDKNAETQAARSNNTLAFTGKSWIGWNINSRKAFLFIDIQFVDKTALCWSIGSAIMIKEAHLSDWKTGDFRLLKRFLQNESDCK